MCSECRWRITTSKCCTISSFYPTRRNKSDVRAQAVYRLGGKLLVETVPSDGRVLLTYF